LVVPLVLQVRPVNYPAAYPEEQAFEIEILEADVPFVPPTIDEEKEDEPEQEQEQEKPEIEEEVEVPVFAGVVIPTEPVVYEKVLE